MAHSIPDASAVALTCELGTVLVTGDYKFDQTPVDGPPTDTARLAELGREGILLLCGDSTNADRVGTTRSEASVGPVLEEIFARAKGGSCSPRSRRTSTASSRRSTPPSRSTAGCRWSDGRCARTSTSPASSVTRRYPKGCSCRPKEIDSFPDHKLVVLTTGSQGEPLSALRRMSHGEHPQVSAALRTTRSSSRRRRSPATSARSTRRSTASTRSARP